MHANNNKALLASVYEGAAPPPSAACRGSVSVGDLLVRVGFSPSYDWTASSTFCFFLMGFSNSVTLDLF